MDIVNTDNKINKKIDYEKKMVFYMIELYCKYEHSEYHKNRTKTFGNKSICKECEDIYNYACERTSKCRFISTKTFCSACSSHCYKKDMKEKIKKIMTFSGKRMLFHKPILALKHVAVMIKHNIKNNKQNKKSNFNGVL
ncbi:nitrous oxide-stimulated promoter family protein [Brachyspira sp.]|nr:nitrous oxide-stimulated promoter family protein [Brachyspira sp.]